MDSRKVTPKFRQVLLFAKVYLLKFSPNKVYGHCNDVNFTLCGVTLEFLHPSYALCVGDWAFNVTIKHATISKSPRNWRRKLNNFPHCSYLCDFEGGSKRAFFLLTPPSADCDVVCWYSAVVNDDVIALVTWCQFSLSDVVRKLAR